MTVITDYQLNPEWGWYDFTMVTAVMLFFTFVDSGLFIWWYKRNRVRVRVAGVFKFYLDKRIVPLAIFTGFSKNVSDPVMQPALKVLDHYPNNLSEGDEELNDLYIDYITVLRSYEGNWPANLQYSFELYYMYRSSGAAYQSPPKDFKDWVQSIYMPGVDRQMIAAQTAPLPANFPKELDGTSTASMFSSSMESPVGTQFLQYPATRNNAVFDPLMALGTRQ